MNRQNWVWAVVIVASLPLLAGQPSYGAIINGDFATGDFTGWTTSAGDDSGGSLGPAAFLSVVDMAGDNGAQFQTGQFDDGLFVATLEQSFLVKEDEPFLMFDFMLPEMSADPTGAGTSPFSDSWTASITSGAGTSVLLLADGSGAFADPFGTATGPVALGVPATGMYDATLAADLGAHAGQMVSLEFTLSNEDDGQQLSIKTDTVKKFDPDEKIPEPTSIALLVIGAIATLAMSKRKRRHSKPSVL